jgi:ubiquinone biosynthesis protein COQ4
MTNDNTPKAKQSTRVRPLVAWRAMQALFKDKEDTGQVFKIIEALKGKSLEKTSARFRSTEVGQKLLSTRPNIVDTLNDREGLRALPEGSFGRTYLDFVERENISADGLTAASDEVHRSESSNNDVRFVGERIRDTHDLYHVLSGYGRDSLGELCLLAYTQEHSRNRGIAFIVYMAQRRNRKTVPHIDVDSCISEAKRNAKAATWLIDQPWEEMLPLPLEEVRQKLGVVDPSLYRKTRPLYDAAIEKLMAEEEARLAQIAA